MIKNYWKTWSLTLKGTLIQKFQTVKYSRKDVSFMLRCNVWQTTEKNLNVNYDKTSSVQKKS